MIDIRQFFGVFCVLNSCFCRVSQGDRCLDLSPAVLAPSQVPTMKNISWRIKWLILHLHSGPIYKECCFQSGFVHVSGKTKLPFFSNCIFVRFPFTILCYLYSCFAICTMTSLRLLPEFFSFFLSSSNLVIPARFSLRPSSPIMASKIPCTRVSYSVQLSRDFSRVPKGRLAG